MKGKTLHFIYVGLFVAFLGCSSGGGGSASEIFYTSARNVAPTVTASANANVALKSQTIKTIDPGSIMSSIYYMIQDYQYPRDEGVIDMHNIYKVLYTASQIYSNAGENCNVITEKEVASPFNLGITDTYDCAGNEGTMSDSYAYGYAIRTASDDTIHILLTFRWAGNEHGALQGSYNQTTGDLDIGLVELVDHDQSRFYIRSRIAGNEGTHAFTISMITGSIADTTDYVSIVGKGISKGTGNYFLFRVKDNSINGNYFCVPADPTESDLETLSNQDPSGATDVDSNCTDYKTDVDAMTFLTTDEVPLSLASFTNSSILISY